MVAERTPRAQTLLVVRETLKDTLEWYSYDMPPINVM